ncbi:MULTISPECIES: nucleotide disphospho-sugar-binding domain-containing protein [unclassified Streptomyces]|uniref:nucleotide disphospho-sugar-binding domain-containing protein n=1 Tax=unclassified Streptomyces TaxID=2593676 RepID=UPI0035DDD590
MRVLVVPFPFRTHLYNLVPLAWSLRTAGHEVRVAGWPDLLDAVAAAGLTGLAVGPGESPAVRRQRDERQTSQRAAAARRSPQQGLDALFDLRPDRARLGWEQVCRVVDDLVLPQARRSNDPMMEDLVAAARAWRPDLVLWGAKAFAGAVAAAAVGAAHARVLYSVDVYTRLREDFLHAQALQPSGRRADTLRDWLAGWAARFGVDFSEDLVGGQFTVAPLPASFRPDERPGTLGVQFVPYNGPAVVPGWLAHPPRAPRVLMTFGDSLDDGPVRLLSAERIQEILDALAGLDIELVLALPPASRRALRAVPANTRVVEAVAPAEVLATCSAVVHHGGTWSFGCALRHGVPQLLIGRAFDAPLKFGCLERAGAGLGMSPDRARGPAVRAALLRLLGDGAVRADARRLQEEMLALPTPNALAHTLQGVAAAHRGRAAGALR